MKTAEEIRDKYTRAWFNEEDDLDNPQTGYMPWHEVLKAMEAYASQFRPDRERVIEILKGIDKTETDDKDGWWETSTGAEFGKRKLNELLSPVESKDEQAKNREEFEKAFDFLIDSIRKETLIPNSHLPIITPRMAYSHCLLELTALKDKWILAKKGGKQ